MNKLPSHLLGTSPKEGFFSPFGESSLAWVKTTETPRRSLARWPLRPFLAAFWTTYKNPTKNRQTPGWRNLHRKSADLHEKSVNLRRPFHICWAWIATAIAEETRRCRQARVPHAAPTGGGRMLCRARWRLSERRGRMGRGMPGAIPLGIRLGREQARVRHGNAEVGQPDGWLGQRPDSLREI